MIVVTRLDRLARSTRDLLDIAERLRGAEAGLRSLAEPWADTISPAGRMVLTDPPSFSWTACATLIALRSASAGVLYQPAYPLTGSAQDRWVREAMRSGMCMSLFQASRHAPTIVS